MVNLRYRKARSIADQLGQVFTPKPISGLLVTSLPTRKKPIRQIIDLGAGEGALTLAALHRYKKAKAFLLEIDSKYIKLLSSLDSSRISVLRANALSSTLALPCNPDVIISNPPYGSLSLNSDIRELLRHSNFSIPMSKNWVRGDIAFMVQAWTLAKKGCLLGLIVASPMIRDPSYQSVRGKIISEMRGLCVTQLDECTFQNTEVRSFLFTGERTVKRRRNVLLRKALADGTIVDELEVGHNAAVISLDIDYHRALARLGLTGNRSPETLGSVGTSIARGSRSQKEFERLGLNAFHTSDFSGSNNEIVLHGTCTGYNSARTGHILIPRVGSRCLTRQARIQDGEGLFTDCVYRLDIPRSVQKRVWNTLTSTFGAEWRLANAAGCCAKHLPVGTLLGMPVLD